MLGIDDITGLYAITPTPSKAGAERWDATDTVDLGELARLTEALVQSGVNGLVAMGTTGECATLTHSEWEQAAACVIETVRR